MAAWLKEDILLRRIKVPKKRRSRGDGHTDPPLPANEQAALREAKALTVTLAVPVTEAAQILADNRKSYILPSTIATATGTNDAKEGTLFTKSTVDAYITAVMELWNLQVAHSSKNTENPRSIAVRSFLDQRGRQKNRHNRTSFKDRGTKGIQAGYSTAK